MELMRLLDPALEALMVPEILLEIPDLTDPGVRADQNQWARARREALTRGEREGTRPNTPAWSRLDAPHVAAGRTLAAALRAQADRDERAALDARAATLRAAALATEDPVVEARRQVTRQKLAAMAEGGDRVAVLLAAIRDGVDGELVAAALTEPAPRELLTPGQRQQVETALVHRRAPSAVRQAYRAQSARRVAMDVLNACGDAVGMKVG
jgi:hypothetical protein